MGATVAARAASFCRTLEDLFTQMKVDYAATGIRHSVTAVMLVHNHNHPHVLLLKNSAPKPDEVPFQLPSGKKKPGESDQTALNRILNKFFSRTPKPRPWDIKDLLTQWWRPRFDAHMFPYQPAHCTKPVELNRWLLVNLPCERDGEDWDFFVPENYKLVAVPLWMLHENVEEYGQLISTLPHHLGRFSVINS